MPLLSQSRHRQVLVAALLITLLIFPGCSKYRTQTGAPQFNRPYLTWQDDPSTTMVVNYQTASLPEEVEVRYDVEALPEHYRHRAQGDSRQIPGLPDGRYINSVALEGLIPGTTYYFRFGNDAEGFSEEYAFRTIPQDSESLRFISGGDTRITSITRALFEKAAAQDPLFVVIGGDLAYADGDFDKIGRWDAWFQHWFDYMVAPDGRLIPMMHGIGNHEVNNLKGSKEERAPFFYGFFPQGGRSYFSHRIGSHLGMIVLDSAHIVEHASQAPWLREQLEQYSDLPFITAVYHVPLYPSHRDFDGAFSAWGRRHWLPLFDAHRLSVGFEHHDHTFKRTKPLRNNAVDARGTLYVGDGSMGVKPRRPKKDLWYMEKTSATPHFWIVDVIADTMLLRAMDKKGAIFDQAEVTARSTQGAS